MKFTRQQYILFAIALLLGILFHYDTIFEYPKYIHAWAQSDRYALALNFLWNDFNFLKAETYLHNIEFPMGFTAPKEDSITMVNFPIHEYIIAILMKITGVTAPILFRFYIFCSSLVGLIYISKLGKFFKLSLSGQILILVFVATSPVYIYYQDGFLPSIPSFSMTLMGIFYYIVYLKKPSLKIFALSIILLTISSLYRTTFIIPQIAIFGVEFIRVIRKNAKISWFLALFVLSGACLYLHRLHNEQQIHTYGSIFLYYIVPALNWPTAVNHFKLTYANWHLDYLNQAQLIFYSTLLILGIKNYKSFLPRGDFKTSLLFFILACLIGYCMFVVAMLSKFPHHDYYFIDTFFIPLILIAIFILRQLELSYLKLQSSKVYFGITLLFCTSSVFFSFNNLRARTMDNAWDYSSELVDIYASGDQILDSLGIKKEAKLMVFGPQYPNLPLILFNRKGYTLFAKKDWEITRALTWEFDYIILPNRYFLKEYHSQDPTLINRFNKIYDNGKFSICTLKNEATHTSLSDFFQLNDKDLMFRINEDFENKRMNYIGNTNFSSKNTLEGEYSGLIKTSQQFGLEFNSDSIKILENYSTKLNINSNFLVEDTLKRLEFVVSIQDKEGNKQFYETFHLENIYKGSKEWHSFELIYQLPRLIKGDYIFKTYYWNRDKGEIYVDNIDYRFYK